MALIIKSDQVTGSDFVPGVLQKLLLEKEKTGQERLQIKQFEFMEEIQFDFKTEEGSLSWLMPLTSNLKYNGLDLGKNSLLILPPNFPLKIEGLIGEKASHGCIRMFNQDVIELFSLVEKGTKVNIVL